MRIAVAGIEQESLTFNPLKMFEEDFRLWRGEQVLEYPGLAAAVQELEIEPVPVFAAQYVTPGGIVDEVAPSQGHHQIGHSRFIPRLGVGHLGVAHARGGVDRQVIVMGHLRGGCV